MQELFSSSVCLAFSDADYFVLNNRNYFDDYKNYSDYNDSNRSDCNEKTKSRNISNIFKII